MIPSTRLLPALLLCLAAACSRSEPTGGSAAGRLQLAVIPKGTTHVFWKAVEKGAQEAAAQLDVDVIWKGPLKENDRAQQIQLVQQFVSQKVDGIAIAPLDHQALGRAIAEAKSAHIPVVIYDSDLDGAPGATSRASSRPTTTAADAWRRAARQAARRQGKVGAAALHRSARRAPSSARRASSR
jgi:ribose transport system substrate-binding protein